MTVKRAPDRRAASPRRKQSRPIASPSPQRRGDANSNANQQKLLHELRTHSEELTVQNEQLLHAHAEIELARDRYADLYDFAPIGYLSIDSRGNIVDTNLVGAALLGHPRSFVLRLPLATLIVPEDQPVLRAFLIGTRERDAVASHTELRVRRDPGRIVRFVASPLGIGAPIRLLTAMFDVTEERRLEAERAAAFEREQARSEELVREVAVRTQAEERVKSLLERLVSVQEEERRRIARNLHDHLGQQMTALRLTVAALKAGPLPPEELRDRLERLDGIATKIDRDLDTIAWDLRPAALDDVGLNAALATLVNDWSKTHGVTAELHVTDPDAIRLTGEVESHLYRVVQEALNNVTKHAAATRVSVLLERRDHNVIVIIEDDGRGFDVEKAMEKGHQRMGLIGMQERAALVGGSMEIESAPGKGTTLFVQMPVHPAINRRMAQNHRNSKKR